MKNPTERQEALEAWIRAEVEEAVEPWKDDLGADALQILREQVETFLRAHPEMVRLRRVFEDRGEVELSGAVGDVTEELPVMVSIAGGNKKR